MTDAEIEQLHTRVERLETMLRRLEESQVSQGGAIFSAGGPVGPAPAGRYVSGIPIPTGTLALCYNAVPSGWVECNGQELRIDDYHELFAVLGTNGGIGTTTEHFKLPTPAQIGLTPPTGAKWIIRT